MKLIKNCKQKFVTLLRNLIKLKKHLSLMNT